MSSRTSRLLIGLGIAVVGLVAIGVAAVHFGAKALQAQIVDALGPNSEVEAVELGFDRIELRKVAIHTARADKSKAASWPAQDELRAARIVVKPSWRDLLSAQVQISSIVVEGGYLSMLRTRDGRLRVLPALLESGGNDSGPGVAVSIDRVEFKDCALEFYDASIRRPAHKLALTELNAVFENLQLPEMNGKSRLDLSAKVKGPRRDGTISLSGSVVLSNMDSDWRGRMRSVDLVAFQPYLIKAAEAGVKRGTLDMDIDATVKAKRLRAPGSLTLTGLELSGNGSFMGLPRRAVVGLLKGGDEQIRVSFTLEGKIDDPQFSLNENFATRVASSMAETLGISLEGLARGVGSAGSSVLEGVGDAVKGLFGK